MKNKLLNYFENISKNKTLLIYIGLALLIYLPSIYFNFFVFDDRDNIFKNSQINSLVDLLIPWQITKIPLSYNYWQLVNYFFGNDSALPFRVLNISFHIINGLLLYNISKKIFSSEKLATFVVGVFLIHPISVQTVIWVSSSREILATLFTLIAINIYLNCAEKKLAIPATLFFWIGSILFKPISILLPLLIPILSKDEDKSKKKSSYIALSVYFIFILLFTFLYVGEIQKSLPLKEYSIIHYLGSFVITSLIYLRNYIMPFFLEFNYSITPTVLNDILTSSDFIYYIISLFIILLSVIYIKNRVYLYSLISFLILVSINSGIIPFNHQFISTVTDRYLYLPAISLIFLLTFSISNLSKRNEKFSIFIISLVLLILSTKEVSKWKTSSDRLYSENPTNSIQSLSYANALIWDHKYSKASLYLSEMYDSSSKMDSDLFHDYLNIRLSLFNNLPKDENYIELQANIHDNLPNIQKIFYPLIANYAYYNNDFDLARTAYAYSKRDKNAYLIDFNIETLNHVQERYEDRIMQETVLIPTRRRLDNVSKRLYKTLRPLVQDKNIFDRLYNERNK